MKLLEIVRALTELGERQGETAKKAAAFLIGLLDERRIPYVVETIETFLPEGTSRLTADGVIVDSAPTSFTGGSLQGKDALVSSLIPTRYLIDVANINFNPVSTALSRPNFYFAPSVAIRSTDVPRILQASRVEGEAVIRKAAHALPQILVGNAKDPSAIVFAHFDSIGPGAIDNASGTATVMGAILSRPDLLTSALFVLDPNEELSYDFPTYWGHGYRVFEERHGDLLASARSIIVVDCVGNGAPQVIGDPRILNLAFPIKGLAEHLTKTVTIGGDIEKMMEVYQGDTDLPELLTEESLRRTLELLVSRIELI